ncbi:MAG: M20 family metallopeptidase [Lentisphaerae bacterium]|nr:M20 family metallopeptidase [Lentisphaerota bacterium]
MEKDCYIDLLCEMIRMRPESQDITAVNRVQRRVQEFLTEKGLYCTMEKDGEREVLFAATAPGKVQDILLCAHLDVVPADNESQYEPYIEGDFLYGRGSSDCMGDAIAIMKAMCNAPEGASLGCIFTADEEIGGKTTDFMVKNGYGARKMGLVMDSGGSVYYAQKGILNLTLTAYGTGGHSARPWAFDNPVVKLVNGLQKLFAEWENPAEAADWRMSMAPTILRAGSVVNRIPDVAEAELNLRLVKLEEKDAVVERIRQVTGLEVKVTESCDPFNSPVDSEEMRTLAAAYSKAFGKEITPGRICGATDARHLYKIGRPVYVSGIDGSGAHSAEEKLCLSSIDKGVAMILELVKQ